MKTVHMLYGREGMELRVPDSADVLVGQDIPAVERPDEAVAAALAGPIGSAPLAEIVAAKRPKTVAITISDITRPVPNKQFLPAMLKLLNGCGIADSQIVIIIGTGMHRPSTPAEREILVGADIQRRIEVIDHQADAPRTLVKVSDDPLVSVCRRFAEAEQQLTQILSPSPAPNIAERMKKADDTNIVNEMNKWAQLLKVPTGLDLTVQSLPEGDEGESEEGGP